MMNFESKIINYEKTKSKINDFASVAGEKRATWSRKEFFQALKKNFNRAFFFRVNHIYFIVIYIVN
jgi:hypothetical protein